MERALSFIVGWVLIFNLLNIFYMSISKRAYYENFFGSLCVYFIALIEKPIIYGIQFSSKYGLSVVELIYGMLVLFFIVRYILSNNSTVIFNTDWKSFCTCANKVLASYDIESSCYKSSLHIDKGISEISLLYTISHRKMILVHFSNMRSISEKINFKEEISELLEGANLISKKSRYGYIFANFIFTLALLIHIRISM